MGALVLFLGAIYYVVPGREVFLVPRGYQGAVVVFYSHPNGVEVPWNWGKRVYRIPKDGVLLVKNLRRSGFQSMLWLYEDEQGNRKEIASESYAEPDYTIGSPVVRGVRVFSPQYAEDSDGQYSGAKGARVYHFLTARSEPHPTRNHSALSILLGLGKESSRV